MTDYQYINIDTYKTQTSTPFNSIYQLEIPIIRKIKNLELLNLQMPLGFYNIRDNCNTFYFLQNSTSRNCNVPVGNYNITTLTSALQTSINSVLVAATSTISYSTTTNKISISISSGTITIDNTLNPILNTIILGFTTNQQSGSNLTSPSCYNINHDLYINLSIDNLPTNFILIPLTAKSRSINFKLLVNANIIGQCRLSFSSSVAKNFTKIFVKSIVP